MIPLPWPFDREYMQLALIAGVVVGATAPLIGTFLVQKRLSLMGDGLGHVAFAGAAAGIAFNVWPVWTALVAATASAVGLEWLRGRGLAAGDMALALVFYTGIAAGVVISGVSGSLNAGILGLLFGQILLVTPGDTVAIAALGVVTAVAVLALWRPLLSIVIDEEAARVAGLPVEALNLLLAAFTAVIVVVGMRAVGVLLVAALMSLPVGAAQRLATSFRSTLQVASAIGAAAAVLGLASARVWSLPAGATIVLGASGGFLLAAARRRRGVGLVAE